jgi:hypothetical protein
VSESAHAKLVRAIVASWESGDFGAAEWAHLEIEFVFADGPDPGTAVGVAAMAARWREQLRHWQEYRVVADEYRELDDGRVLLLNRFEARGRASGLEVGSLTHGACLFEVRQGRVRRLVLYWDRERALAELGLDPGG